MFAEHCSKFADLLEVLTIDPAGRVGGLGTNEVRDGVGTGPGVGGRVVCRAGLVWVL